MKKFLLPLVILASILSSCLAEQEQTIDDLSVKAENLQEMYTPVKFRIDEKRTDRIYATMKFYNVKGEEVAKQKIKLNGTELAFDFYVIPVDDRFLAFPTKVFTNKIAPDKGKYIMDVYTKNGFPQIFNKPEMTESYTNGIKAAYSYAKANILRNDSTAFGNTVHDLEGISSFLPGHVYKIQVLSKGGIEVVEE